jgi:NhaP-type Na+/H+ or K+/H+ antiporter
VLGTGLGILVGPRYMQIYDPRGWGVSSSSTFAPSIFSSLLSGSKIFSEALSVTNETIPYSPFPYPTPESTTATLELTRVVLAVGLFAIGVELPQRYVYEHARSVAVMVFSTMTVGWFISAGTRARCQ